MERIDLYYSSFKSNNCIEYINIKIHKIYKNYIKYIKINKYSLLEPSDKIAIFLGRHGIIIGSFSHPFFFFPPERSLTYDIHCHKILLKKKCHLSSLRLSQRGTSSATRDSHYSLLPRNIAAKASWKML